LKVKSSAITARQPSVPNLILFCFKLALLLFLCPPTKTAEGYD
jgi:hypothetical protein